MPTKKKLVKDNVDLGDYKYGFSMPERSVRKTKTGINAGVVAEISGIKKEPKWMLDFRLRSYEIFKSKPMPNFGADLSGIDFDAITYYLKATDKKSRPCDHPPGTI